MSDTVKLYRKDVYLKQAEAEILAVLSDPDEIKALGGREADSSRCLVLDQTVFFPEGGGQPCDLGDIGPWPVIYVFEKDGVVYHQILEETPAEKSLEKEPGEMTAKAPGKVPGKMTAGAPGKDPGKMTSKALGKDPGEMAARAPEKDPDELAAGTRVTCRLDWDRRFCHMQRHCGEHILSAVFYDLCGGINRGFHMGEDYMTIDIRLENRPDIPALTEELILAAEWEANRMIWDDLPVSIRHFETREEALDQPMRKTLAIDEDITLVCVGDENKASGCVACCGTHPAATGQVGLIKLYKWESYKGMYRVTFDAGAAALSNYREQAEVLKLLGQRYSSDTRGLMGKIDAKEQKEREIRQELYELKTVYLNEQKEEILKTAAGQTQASTAGQTQASAARGQTAAAQRQTDREGVKPLVREYSCLKPDDLIALARLLPKDLPGLFALVAAGENTVILFSSGDPDCAKIVRDNAGIWKGKGGGRPDNARAMFPSRQDLDCFMDFINKAY